MCNDEKRLAPENTTKEVKEDPMGIFAESVLTGTSATIERQEADGQQSFVGSDTLPTNIRCGDYDAKTILEAAGVKFLGVVDDDPLFQYVELPEGWKKVVTDHSMWSILVDDQGRERASIFYKAAFYDRKADMSLSTRFRVQYDYERDEKDALAVENVMDCGKIVHTTKPIRLPTKKNTKYFKLKDKAKKTAVSWLDKNYPDWQNPGAYWD